MSSSSALAHTLAHQVIFRQLGFNKHFYSDHNVILSVLWIYASMQILVTSYVSPPSTLYQHVLHSVLIIALCVIAFMPKQTLHSGLDYLSSFSYRQTWWLCEEKKTSFRGWGARAGTELEGISFQKDGFLWIIEKEGMRQHGVCEKCIQYNISFWWLGLYWWLCVVLSGQACIDGYM